MTNIVPVFLGICSRLSYLVIPFSYALLIRIQDFPHSCTWWFYQVRSELVHVILQVLVVRERGELGTPTLRPRALGLLAYFKFLPFQSLVDVCFTCLTDFGGQVCKKKGRVNVCCQTREQRTGFSPHVFQ